MPQKKVTFGSLNDGDRFWRDGWYRPFRKTGQDTSESMDGKSGFIHEDEVVMVEEEEEL